MPQVVRTLREVVHYEPHPPRTRSAKYNETHRHLILDLDAPCWVCGARRSTGGHMETHHDLFEWAAQFGLDLDKVTRDWPDITDRDKLAEWVDSENNMLVLCAEHHRARGTGIHAITYPVWLLQRYQGDEWTFITQHAQAGVPVTAHTPLLAGT